jgi:hypothetical protein
VDDDVPPALEPDPGPVVVLDAVVGVVPGWFALPVVAVVELTP